ncbi:hypothetical protein [Microbacterium sp. G2-8]|uniref:hypothetical protein n=1 Tax=Microbacterium sp. G2-8 TaxID=2842454 RepID=UPI001C8A3A16|nr:hypothetical protein [Microbacterium sp. G2-8]
MSTTLTTPAAAPAAAPAPTASRVTFGTLLRAEWISLSSLRGNIVSLFIGIALVVLPAAAFATLWAYDFSSSGGDTAMLEWIPPVPAIALNGSIFAIAVAVIVGAAAYAKEHATGSLRSQLAASPRRVPMLLAKAAVVGAAVFVATIIAFALAYAVSSVVYSIAGLPLGISDPVFDVIVPILGGALAATAVAIFALGIASLLRSETWAVTLTLVFLFIIPMLLLQVPWEWGPQVSELLLGSTLQTLASGIAEFTGMYVRDLALTLGWAAAAFLGGAIVVSRRDA